MPPNWPLVSHDSGLFQGTEETGCPLESTFSAAGVVDELEQPAWKRANGRRSRSERKRIMRLRLPKK